tara:strand:+ start:202 stop:708 length:507 start_codon:yes stop_codon:yes gene_type:complete
MKQIFIFILFLPLLGCVNLVENNNRSINFNCPRVFFSSEDRVYIDNSISLDNIKIKAEFNNFAINEQCQQKQNVVVIPIDILIVAYPLKDFEESSLSLPIYVSLLDSKDEILETQYFSVLGVMNRSSEANNLIESDITVQLQIITKYLNTTQLVIGFMLDEKKKELLN